MLSNYNKYTIIAWCKVSNNAKRDIYKFLIMADY